MSSKLLIPGAIFIAGAFIAASLILSGGNSAQTQNNNHGNSSTSVSNLREVTSEDHIRGNPDAQVSIIEYSDFECPFCARLHPTLSIIVEDFDGEVNWVYRHFPLSSIHFKADVAAEASECIAELGGNDAFWEFVDGLFANQSRLGNELYNELAGGLGISSLDLEACLDSNRHRSRVLSDRQNAIDTGGRGTPYTVIVNQNGEAIPFSGALRYDSIKQLVERVMN